MFMLTNINILPSRVSGWTTSLNITLFPGTNLIDLYCQNQESNSWAGLIFYVKHNTTGALLCQSGATVKWRIV